MQVIIVDFCALKICCCHIPMNEFEGCPVLPTGVQTVRRIPWTSQDPPLVFFQTQAVYRIFQYYFLVLIRPNDFVVMITEYSNISQESRILELTFFTMIVEVTNIQELKHEMVSVHSSCDLGVP